MADFTADVGGARNQAEGDQGHDQNQTGGPAFDVRGAAELPQGQPRESRGEQNGGEG